MKHLTSLFVAATLAALSAGAAAHVSLQTPNAQAGRPVQATFVVGHGCDGTATTSIAVQIPAGFSSAKPQPKAGWTVAATGATASWTATTREAALPSAQRGEFVLAGLAPAKPGSLVFKLTQTCEKGSVEWAQLPGDAGSTAALKTPAAILTVLGDREFAAWQAQPVVSDAWARAAVAGQQATGAYMRLKAREAVQLVSVATPAAGIADVHEMKMDGNVMRMRPAGAIELPAGGTLELKPGGFHVMLQELKEPLAAGATLPLTLTFRNKAGVESKLDVKVPVTAQAPGASGGAATDGHKH